MNLPWIDIVIIVFFTISILIGVYRGFVKEVLSVASWGLAAFMAFRFGEQASVYVKPYVSQQPLDLAIAYVAVFLVTLIGFSVVSHIVSKIFESSGMTGIDRSIGSLFGALRAAAIVVVLILVGRFMAMDNQQWWMDSWFIPYFEPLVVWFKTYLPADIIAKIEA
jgi:membrane protein required for colicin V production